jgi:hypothetical protein
MQKRIISLTLLVFLIAVYALASVSNAGWVAVVFQV